MPKQKQMVPKVSQKSKLILSKNSTVKSLLNFTNTKPTNPKDFVGASKIPFHLIPNTALVHLALAMLDGACKYGRSNYRAIGVRSSIYFDAAKRHLTAWFEGGEYPNDSEVHHLGHALACIAIILDAKAKGNLTDDRCYPGGYSELVKEQTKKVEKIKKMYLDRNPVHYTLEYFNEQIQQAKRGSGRTIEQIGGGMFRSSVRNRKNPKLRIQSKRSNKRKSVDKQRKS
jgi:hypothetical protein